MAVFEMPYYHTTLTISAACSMYAVHSRVARYTGTTVVSRY